MMLARQTASNVDY